MWARHGRSYDESDYLINLSEDANIINDGKGGSFISTLSNTCTSYQIWSRFGW